MIEHIKMMLSDFTINFIRVSMSILRLFEKPISFFYFKRIRKTDKGYSPYGIITKRVTSLPYDIWIELMGKERIEMLVIPHIWVVIDKFLIPVSISVNPKILSHSAKTIPNIKAVFLFVITNVNTLQEWYYGGEHHCISYQKLNLPCDKHCETKRILHSKYQKFYESSRVGHFLADDDFEIWVYEEKFDAPPHFHVTKGKNPNFEFETCILIEKCAYYDVHPSLDNADASTDRLTIKQCQKLYEYLNTADPDLRGTTEWEWLVRDYNINNRGRANVSNRTMPDYQNLKR
ncbi:MAG: hypothetical protein ACOX8O_02320 [Christensenellales bacterium]|jgi:hypothetical protein